MRVPLAWLRDYVDLPDDTGLIVRKLANLGFPVEEVIAPPRISGVVVGKITKIERHPNADKLQVCTIDVGGERALTILTAATNVAAEQIIPVATLGAQLPHLKIEPRKMRGIDSEGMLCSAEELGLEASWFEDGILQLDANTPLGEDVVRFFRLDQPVLDVEVTANRPDALCMVGIARELAAAFGTACRVPASSVTYGGEFVDDRGNVVDRSFDSLDIRVTLESLDCRRFVAQRISGVRVRPAKAWMRVRLALAGQRPISNIVDISNFVMLELGQPLHFYDFERIAGAHLIVRDGISGESITTLDGVTRELDATALVIADDAQPSCLAGLLGGSVSEVSNTTRELVIEAANFSGPRIRRMSVKLGVRTEASSRHEKGLPLGLPDIGAARAARLLEQEGATIHYPRPFGKTAGDPRAITLTSRDVERLLGFTLDDTALHAALTSLGFTVKSAGDAAFLVTVPPWRTDVAIAADLVEEIARVVGYDRLVDAIPAIEAQSLTSAAFDREMEIATTLAGLGYHECMTLALQPLAVAQRWRAAGITVPDPVEITNPLSEDQRWMRFSLLPALLAHAARERTTRPLRTFEIGHVFANSGGEPHETNVVALLATTPSPAAGVAWRDDAFLAAKSDVLAFLRRVCGADATATRGSMPGLHPGKTAELRFGEHVAGWIGVVDPRLARAYDIEADVVAAVLLVDALPAKAVRSAVTLSKYPAIERDLALVVAPDVAAGDIVDASRAAALVRHVDVFDEYRGPQIGEGKKSLALRVTLQSDTATLTDADADAAIATIITGLRERFGAVLRG